MACFNYLHFSNLVLRNKYGRQETRVRYLEVWGLRWEEKVKNLAAVMKSNIQYTSQRFEKQCDRDNIWS